MEYPRILKLHELLEEKSHFLLGPRSTGKSFLIQKELSEKALTIDLLQTEIFMKLMANPSLLEKIIEGHDFSKTQKRWIVIDEIQKIPALLNEVHRLIEKKKWTFLLTGSSARKLREAGVNLLGGRARKTQLFPLTYKEFKYDLLKRLKYGGIPRVLNSKNPEEELFDYVDLYLKEEIYAEALIRKLPPFIKFLRLAAQYSTEQIVYSNIASDVGNISASNIKNYFDILEDSLIGYTLPAWKEAQTRKSASKSKFYFFDSGITLALSGQFELNENSNLFGKLFEQNIINEINAYNIYNRKRKVLSYWQSKHKNEVDLLIGEEIAIEIKASSQVNTKKHLKGLRALEEENLFKKFYLVSQDPIDRKEDNINLCHWSSFLTKLWNHEIF